MHKLRQMSIFAHIVEQGSVSAAALKLDLSKSVVSQHLKRLEEELGASLLKRTTRRQVLTPMGERFYLSCKDLNNLADSAWESAQSELEEPQGRIKITAPNALMDVLVAPVIAELMKTYPKLQPELLSDDQRLDFMSNDIDLAIRVGSSPDSTLKQKRLGGFRDQLCGVVSMRGRDLNALPYIANAWQGREIVHHFESNTGTPFSLYKQAHCVTNSIHSCVALIKAGAGVGVLPDFYLKQYDEQLINLTPLHHLPVNTVYALNPYMHHTPIAVSLCVEALEARLSEELTGTYR